MKPTHIFIAIIAILILGCSGNPTVPYKELLPQTFNTISTNVGVFGAYELCIETESMTANLIQKRTSAIGESYIVSGMPYFTMSPCPNCFNLRSISLTIEGNLQLEFHLKHPFEKGDSGKDPSATNRLDLDIFDLTLVVVPKNRTPDTYSLTGVSVYSGILASGAGYICELGNLFTDNSALPYALVVDDSVGGISTWNRFAMGDSTDFGAEFVLSSNPMRFELYLTFGYGFSAKRPQRLIPMYYNPEFNRKAAWKVEVTPPEGEDPPAFGNTWDDKNNDNPFDVSIKVYDWQIGANVNPTLASPTDVYASSEVSMVSVEIPGMNNTLPSTVSPDSGTGMPTNPLVFNVPVANENLLPVGVYTGLVKVADERNVGLIPPSGDRDYLIDTPDGIVLDNYAIPEYATYQTFTATVVPGCGPVVGQILSPSCPVTGILNSDTIDFTVTASSANGGNPIVQYQADYDFDGTFIADDFNTDGIFTNGGPFTVQNPCNDNIPQTFIVAFRATDSCEPPNQTIFATCDVTVDTCCGPITGSIISPPCPVIDLINGKTVDFTVSASSANGGNPIVLYQADYDYNGTTFNADDSNATGIFLDGGPFTVPNPCENNIPETFTVAFRATDSCNPPNITIFATCDVTVNNCCTDQELFYDFAGCTVDPYNCQGWSAYHQTENPSGGCGLVNSAAFGYGMFSWECHPYGNLCNGEISMPYLTTVLSNAGCQTFHESNIDVNVTSPTINLPESDDAVIEFDYCMQRCSTCNFQFFISENGCTGPWIELWNTTQDDCNIDTIVDIDSYSGSNIMFRFRYYGTQNQYSNNLCGTAGVTIDNIRIYGCFDGTLYDN